ncbi:DMT family transporter [Roseomonas hellenica]|uniref:DMT family transporter n=1 Tax=Plastoroseomonas hellenica TaxID=2687306 RepID=A0ABS5F9Z7_9PROT|nr:DMT family transporter [Plastoroseomonas hellenica]MBR0669396.1 DMT family transporter [Plastoroseomonas hellenica]
MRGDLATAPGIGQAIRRRSGDGGWLGVALIAASALTFSTAGLFTGLIQADAWTILFWRSLFGGLFIGAIILRQHGAASAGAFRAIGRPGLLAAGCSTVGTICFVHALRLTTVADVTVIYATAPFIAAAVAWLWMRQRESRTTLGASLLALLGVMVMCGPVRAEGHLAGNLLALAMTALIATMMVIIRRHRGVSMLPAACLSAFACALVVWPFASPVRVTGTEMLWLALFGTVQFGGGLLLLTLGSRLMSAARAALIGNLELPLAPLWIWLAFGAWPPPATWIGGAIVMAALALDMAAGQRRTAA